jgi:transketolase
VRSHNVSLASYRLPTPHTHSSSCSKPDLLVVSTGTEVPIAVDGAKKLAAASGKRVAVASLMCCEVFAQQSREYQLSVIPDGIPVLSIEAAHVHGWEKYAHASIGMTYFGKSAPGPVSREAGVPRRAAARRGAHMGRVVGVGRLGPRPTCAGPH